MGGCMRRIPNVLSVLFSIVAWQGVAGQIPGDRARGVTGREGAPVPCLYMGGPYLPYWKCMAARLRGTLHALNRRDLPHDALHAAMRAGDISISAGPTDSIYWSLSIAAHGVDTRDLPDAKFHAGPSGS